MLITKWCPHFIIEKWQTAKPWKEARLQKRRKTNLEKQPEGPLSKKRAWADDKGEERLQKRVKHTATRKDKPHRAKKQKQTEETEAEEKEEDEIIMQKKVR